MLERAHDRAEPSTEVELPQREVEAPAVPSAKGQ
jgi:hypothetical protein